MEEVLGVTQRSRSTACRAFGAAECSQGRFAKRAVHGGDGLRQLGSLVPLGHTLTTDPIAPIAPSQVIRSSPAGRLVEFTRN